MDWGVEQQVLGQRQQTQLYGGGEASGVGDMAAAAHHGLAVELGQAVYEVVALLGQTEVLCEVDDLERLGQRVGLDKPSALAMWSAAEQHINIVERGLRREVHVNLAYKTFVDRGHGVSGVGRRVYPFYLDVGMVDEQAYELAGCVSGAA